MSRIAATVTTGTAANEAALITAISTAWGLRGGTVVTTSGITWMYSSGEDGYSRVVFGLEDNSGRIRGYTGSDMDLGDIVGSGVRGYNYKDTATAGPGIYATTSTSATWDLRTGAVPYSYALAVTLDGVACVAIYESGSAVKSQAIIAGGKLLPCPGKQYLAFAKSRVASVDNSTPSAPVLTLEDDLSAFLKAPSAANEGVYTAGGRIWLQAIQDTDPDANEIGMCMSALPTAISGTDIILSTASGVKLLTATTGRYATGQGAGDLVRLLPEPNFALCFAGTLSEVALTGTSGAGIITSDRYGGQLAGTSSQMNFDIHNELATDHADGGSIPETGGRTYYHLYAYCNAYQDAIMGHTADEGNGTLGYIPNLIVLPDASLPDFSIYQIDGDVNRQYVCFSPIVRPSAKLTATDTLIWGVGPGA